MKTRQKKRQPIERAAQRKKEKKLADTLNGKEEQLAPSEETKEHCKLAGTGSLEQQTTQYRRSQKR